jgi:hypothetical protein
LDVGGTEQQRRAAHTHAAILLVGAAPSREASFGEPIVDRHEKRNRLYGPILVAPQPGEARGGAKFPGQGSLPAGPTERLPEVTLGRRCGFGRVPFTGGNFWDARSTGYLLQSPDAEQAQHPPVDSQEMGNPDTACIAWKISQAAYRPLFGLVWGVDLNINWPSNVSQICATPEGAFPIC